MLNRTNPDAISLPRRGPLLLIIAIRTGNLLERCLAKEPKVAGIPPGIWLEPDTVKRWRL
ncbi:MAG: hypothetical protein R6U93_09355 [Dehalococcoidia bacterium]